MHPETVPTSNGELSYDETRGEWILRDPSGRPRRVSAARAVALLGALVSPAAIAATVDPPSYGSIG